MELLSPQELARLRRSSLHAALGTSIGAALVVGALVYGMWQLHAVGRQVKEAEGLRDKAVKELDQVRTQLTQTQEELNRATDLLRYNHPIDYADLKGLAVGSGRSFPVLERALQLRQRNVKFKLGGRTPEEGFDSVTFADYVLRSALRRGADRGTGPVVWADFKKVDQPQVGDLAFYAPSYSMLYFKDLRGNPFVIGMTPLGVASLKPDFAPSQGYRRVPYAGE